MVGRFVRTNDRVPTETEKVGVVVNCLTADFSSCSQYGREVVNFCRIVSSKVYFFAIESKLQRQWDLGFRTEYYFVGCLSSCVVETRIVSKSEFPCQARPIVSSVVQEVPPVVGNVLILGFNFAISPRRVCCSRSRGDAQFFSPVNEVSIDESNASVVYNRQEFRKNVSFSHQQI